MNKHASRTNPEEIKILTDFYYIFRPYELQFLLEMNKRWSMYDINRNQNMAVILRQAFTSEHSESDVERAIKYFDYFCPLKLDSPITVDMALAQFNQSIHLNPYRSECPTCSSVLNLEMVDVKSVRVYTLSGRITSGKVFSISCKHSGTNFKMQPSVLVFSNFFRQGKTDTFTSVSFHNGQIVYLGGEHAYERALIESFTCHLLNRASSWLKFVDGMNLSAFNSCLTEVKEEWRKRLSEAFMKYKTIELDLCFGAQTVQTPCSLRDFDGWAWKEFPRLLSAFVYLWSNHKTFIGPCGADCSQCIVIDGHQKCRRRVCRAKHVQVSTEEFQSLAVGCCRTPCRGSHFCQLHQSFHDENDTPEKAAAKRKQSREYRIARKFIWKKSRQHTFGATSCRTLKEQSNAYILRCSRSFGIIAGVTNCKILITFAEIFRSETLREIVSLLCSTIRASDHNFPLCVVYDDGCHLVQFVRNHYGRDLGETSASKILYDTKFSVDRTHFKGHVGRWCRKNMNPNENPMLNGVNTQAAEQFFSWLKGYASILSALGWRRMPVYLLLLFHYKNLQRLNIRPTQIFNIASSVPLSSTISLSHVADSQSVHQQEQTMRGPTESLIDQTNVKLQVPSSKTKRQANSLNLHLTQSIQSTPMPMIEQMVATAQKAVAKAEKTETTKRKWMLRKNRSNQKKRQETTRSTKPQ